MARPGDDRDILQHLRGRNRFIHPNMVADLPPDPDDSPNNDGSIPPNQNNQQPRLSSWISRPLEIVLLSGKTIRERTRSTKIVCEMDPYSVMVELKQILKCEKILTPLDHFVFGFCDGPKGKMRSIYDYKIGHIDFENEFDHFLLQQISEPNTEPTSSSTSSSKANNKKLYDERNSAMTEAEATLRKELPFGIFSKLRKNRKLMAKYKYDMGVLCRTFDEIKDEIYVDLGVEAAVAAAPNEAEKQKETKKRRYESDDDSDDGECVKRRRRKRRRRSSPAPTSSSTSMDDFMDLMKLQMMANSNNASNNNSMDDIMSMMKMKMMKNMMDSFNNNNNNNNNNNHNPPSTTLPPPLLPPLPAPATAPAQVAPTLPTLSAPEPTNTLSNFQALNEFTKNLFHAYNDR